jgi:hypothetical protein
MSRLSSNPMGRRRTPTSIPTKVPRNDQVGRLRRRAAIRGHRMGDPHRRPDPQISGPRMGGFTASSRQARIPVEYSLSLFFPSA